MCLRQFLFLSHFFFFDDESDNGGSGYGSSGTCPFTSSSHNYVCRASGSGSEMVKCSFPFFNDDMVNSFLDGEMGKVGRVTEIFSKVGRVTEQLFLTCELFLTERLPSDSNMINIQCY